MAGRFHSIFRLSFAWAGVWALLGLAVGILLTLWKAPIIAESGAKPQNLSDYAFWVPVMSVVLGLFGFLLGFLFSSLMALTERWRVPIEARLGLLAKYGPRLLCGAVSGGLICLPITQEPAEAGVKGSSPASPHMRRIFSFGGAFLGLHILLFFMLAGYRDLGFRVGLLFTHGNDIEVVAGKPAGLRGTLRSANIG